MACGEFSLIARYFDRIHHRRPDVEIGIGDDCALLNIPANQTLAISTDTLVVGNHFLPDIHPADLAHKALASNVSDLAAMGAEPAWVTLALTLPTVNEAWLAAFSDSLFAQMETYGLQLIGGDTTKGPLSITIGIHGYIPVGQALKRSGAKAGDRIYVTGTPGDSAAGLAILLDKLHVSSPEDEAYLLQRHLRPTPRIPQGLALRGLASSALDISDGIISDLGHILKASNVGAVINLDLLPYSAAMRRCVAAEQACRWALSGGEDYELCFTVPEAHCSILNQVLSQFNVPFTCIGQIRDDIKGLHFTQNEKAITLDWKGYDHFG